jgi:hypothetical protein
MAFPLSTLGIPVDKVGLTSSAASSLFLKLDQTTPQTVVNDAPIFEEGICFGNATTKFILNGNTAELWLNGSLVQSWTYTPVAPDLTGQPWGLLLAITHPS